MKKCQIICLELPQEYDTVSGKKWNQYYFRHNLDKQKYIVVMFAYC